MAIFADSRCLLCQLERNLSTARKLGTEEQALAFAKDLMTHLASAPMGVPAPYFTPGVTELFHRHYGLSMDRYRDEKRQSNAFVLERMDSIRQRVIASSDPVLTGLKFAILGNYIDFSALRDQVSFEFLDELLLSALDMELDAENYTALCAELEQGKRLLYLTDNAGEIVFDRVWLEVIRDTFPGLSITVCVRGGPAQNDATVADAEAVGMPFPVIGNGTCISGTVLEKASDELRTAIERADVVISKGQANVETLLDTGHGYNIYYAFLVKCKRFIDRFGKEKLTPMLVRERDL